MSASGFHARKHWVETIGSIISPLRCERGTFILISFFFDYQPASFISAIIFYGIQNDLIGIGVGFIDFCVFGKNIDTWQVVCQTNSIVVWIVCRCNFDSAGADSRSTYSSVMIGITLPIIGTTTIFPNIFFERSSSG